MNSERRYRGRTPGEALAKARAELGDDARLVSARRVSAGGLPPVYEVRVTGAAPAAAPEADPALGELRHEIRALQETVSSLVGSVRPRIAASPAPEPAEEAPLATVPFEEDETASPDEPTPVGAAFAAPAKARRATSPSAPVAEPAPFEPALEPWRDLLRRRGVGARATDAIIETAGRHLENRLHDDPRDAVRTALADRFGPPRRRDRLGDRSTLFVGPAGAGKTTTVAKVAAELVAAGQRPMLVCADGESLTGEESLQAVAAALGLPFETAFLDGALEALVERSGADRTYLVDTCGTAPGDRRAIERLRQVADALGDPEILLVLSATSDLEEARLAARAFDPLGAERIVLTHLDEMTRPGRLVDLAASLPHPVARVTYGRSARGASAPPGSDAVVARILGSDLAFERTA
jgi:flagellar biosynthesis GTPase FlhF